MHSWCLLLKGKKKRQNLRSQSRVHLVGGGVPGRAQTGHLGVHLSLVRNHSTSWSALEKTPRGQALCWGLCLVISQTRTAQETPWNRSKDARPPRRARLAWEQRRGAARRTQKTTQESGLPSIWAAFRPRDRER